MKIKELTDFLETWTPLSLQEDYDNCGLLVGDKNASLNGVLISLDVTAAVLEEAKNKQCNLIVAHHPIIFKGLKKITGGNYTEKIIIDAIKADIAIYAIHTNLDNRINGVNFKIAEMLGLKEVKVLKPKNSNLFKFQIYVPADNLSSVKAAVFEAGAGSIGNYTECTFETQGTGSFKPMLESNPSTGKIGEIYSGHEIKLEVITDAAHRYAVEKAMLQAHNYETPAYDIIALENANPEIGSGAIGLLDESMPVQDFLAHLKNAMQLKNFRYTPLIKSHIKTVAVCGGVGSFLIPEAKKAGADIFISSDIKYHEFFDAENQLIIADIGHYESEKYTKDLILEKISKKFTNFASYLSEVYTNPINFYHF
jgi:dinuclear metal center YbgI/SA1388 family protein